MVKDGRRLVVLVTFGMMMILSLLIMIIVCSFSSLKASFYNRKGMFFCDVSRASVKRSEFVTAVANDFYLANF